MKIVMLGHSGVGKTTYMASMYGLLQSSINGFSLRTEYSTDHELLIKNFYAIKRGNYPNLTAQRSEYKFELLHYDENIFPFHWVDYRGGAIGERSNSSEQARILKEDLLNANGIIVFCDCPTLESGNIRTSGIQRLISLLSVKLREVSHSIPIAVVLTKADMVSNLGKHAIEVIKPLLETIRASDNIIGSVMPIACGEEMTNVEIPLLFNLFIGINLELYQTTQLLEKHIKKSEIYRNKSNFFDWVDSRLSGKPTWGDLADNQIEEAWRKYYKLQKLEPSAESLGQFLEGLPIIGGGAD